MTKYNFRLSLACDCGHRWVFELLNRKGAPSNAVLMTGMRCPACGSIAQAPAPDALQIEKVEHKRA